MPIDGAGMTFSRPISDRYFEDYVEGDVHRFGSITVEADEIIAFAKRFDPQTMHTDSEAAKRSPFGGLIASGWHTAGLMMRLYVEHYLTHVARILRQAVDAVRCGDNVVLSPAFDGGYTLIGLSKPHARLFAEIPWSTSEVYERTLDRAREVGVPVVNVSGWYDVDDATSLRMLEAELSGEHPPFAAMDLIGAEAPATRQFMRARQTAPVT